MPLMKVFRQMEIRGFRKRYATSRSDPPKSPYSVQNENSSPDTWKKKPLEKGGWFGSDKWADSDVEAAVTRVVEELSKTALKEKVEPDKD